MDARISAEVPVLISFGLGPKHHRPGHAEDAGVLNTACWKRPTLLSKRVSPDVIRNRHRNREKMPDVSGPSPLPPAQTGGLAQAIINTAAGAAGTYAGVCAVLLG